MGITKVYHGTSSHFSRIDLLKSRDRRDFGSGFYVTIIYEQAEQWAQNIFLRRGGEKQIVKVYEYNDELSNLKKCIFNSMNKEQLEFIKDNRTKGGVPHDFDIVTGPVANDNTMRTIALYISGIYTVDMTLKQLRFSRANNQISFHTEKALAALSWKNDIEVPFNV